MLCGFTQSGGSGISGSFAGGKITGAVNFGFGSQAQTFGTTAASAVASTKTKELAELPGFTTPSIVVHGSGECDQLDLGDDMRERKEPTLSKSLNGQSISLRKCRRCGAGSFPFCSGIRVQLGLQR